MSLRVLYLQNGRFDPPGFFGTVLRDECGVELDVIHAWQGEPVPAAPSDWAGIAVGGGYMSAYEKEAFPFLEEEEALIRAAVGVGRPVLGMCLGAQLMAGALGGRAFPNTLKEIGFFDVRFEADEDPLWRALPQPFRPVHWHGDTFSLPPGAVRLASSEITENQLFRVGDRHYGVQFHLEIDGPVLRAMVEADDGWLPGNGVDPAALLAEAETELPRVEPVARTVFQRWTREVLAR